MEEDEPNCTPEAFVSRRNGARADKIDLSSETDKYKDYRFTKKLTKEAGVLTIPPSAFYSEAHKHLGENYARFCFIKKDENLALTEKLLKEWNAKKK